MDKHPLFTDVYRLALHAADMQFKRAVEQNKITPPTDEVNSKESDMVHESDWEDKSDEWRSEATIPKLAQPLPDDPFRYVKTETTMSEFNSTQATMPKPAQPILDDAKPREADLQFDPALEGSSLKGSMSTVLQLNATLHSEIDNLMLVAKELALLRAKLQGSLESQDQYIQSTAEAIRVPFTPKELIDGKIRELDDCMDRISNLRTILSKNVEQLRNDCRLEPVNQLGAHTTEDPSWKKNPDPNFDPEALIKKMEEDIQHPPNKRPIVPTTAARSFLGPNWGGGKG